MGEASRRFFLYLDKMLSLHDTIKFMMAILVNLKKQAQHQLQNFSVEMGDNEEDDKENQKGLGDSNIVNQNESTVLKDGSIRLANDTLPILGRSACRWGSC